MKFSDQQRVSGQGDKKQQKQTNKEYLARVIKNNKNRPINGQGDSGGPLTVVDSEERHTLVGLVSRKLFENQCNEVGIGVRKKVFL